MYHIERVHVRNGTHNLPEDVGRFRLRQSLVWLSLLDKVEKILTVAQLHDEVHVRA